MTRRTEGRSHARHREGAAVAIGLVGAGDNGRLDWGPPSSLSSEQEMEPSCPVIARYGTTRATDNVKTPVR